MRVRINFCGSLINVRPQHFVFCIACGKLHERSYAFEFGRQEHISHPEPEFGLQSVHDFFVVQRAFLQHFHTLFRDSTVWKKSAIVVFLSWFQWRINDKTTTSFTGPKLFARCGITNTQRDKVTTSSVTQLDCLRKHAALQKKTTKNQVNIA